MAKISRHDVLTGEADEEVPEEGVCPICKGRLAPAARNRPASCDHCGYPRNAAAHIDYDGCC